MPQSIRQVLITNELYTPWRPLRIYLSHFAGSRIRTLRVVDRDGILRANQATRRSVRFGQFGGMKVAEATNKTKMLGTVRHQRGTTCSHSRRPWYMAEKEAATTLLEIDARRIVQGHQHESSSRHLQQQDHQTPEKGRSLERHGHVPLLCNQNSGGRSNRPKHIKDLASSSRFSRRLVKLYTFVARTSSKQRGRKKGRYNI